MTKKELFSRIITHSVIRGIQSAYGIDFADPSEKQKELVDIISNQLYDRIGNKLTLKELQEQYSELYKTTDSIQEN